MHPLRNRLRALAAFPFGRKALAALLYGVIAFPLALVGFVLTFVGLLVGGVLSVTTLGLWLVAVTVRGALALGRLQRGLARGLLGLEIEEPERREGAGVLGWRRVLLGDRSGRHGTGRRRRHRPRPEVVTQLFGASRRATALDRLTPREREVLALMAEGRTNQSIAGAVTASERAVEKHIANIFTKLDLPPSGTGHRRVLAVLRYRTSFAVLRPSGRG
ncbi:regulatory LuxR family protein [Streptomyces sp. Ag82_O1-15]|jgi:DNA-binding CsgD family transcriptional regulator|nr:regulatory LuxR family protein [Streptomyces sp. Ag82_O1-15]